MPDGPPVLRQTEQGPTLDWGPLSLYPSSDPREYARRRARLVSPRPDTLFFVPSVGLGYGLAELLDHLPPRSAVLCLDVRQEIMALAERAGLPRDPRLLIARTDSTEGAAEALRRLGGAGLRRVVRQPLCTGYRIAPELYDRLQAFLEEEIRRYWRNRLTLIALGSLQVRNLLANIAALPGARDLGALKTDMPVLVAGAGPSLDGSLEAMKRLRSRFVLVAADTALPALDAAGILPDLVVAIEAQAANLQDFIGRSDDGRIALACDLSAWPALTRLFPGRLFLFSSSFAPLRIFDRLRLAGLLPCPFPALGSVGVSAVSAALRLTPAPVFLTGLDFSFPRGRTHARGSTWHLAMLSGASREAPVEQAAYAAFAARPLITEPGKNGAPVRTDTLLRSYRDNLALELAGSAGRVSDLGADGLATGAVPVSLREFEKRIGDAPPAQGLCAAAERPFSPEAVAGFLSAEQSALRETAEAAAAAARGGPTGELARLLRNADYAWAHFPDIPDVDHPDPGFLARAVVAVRWYARRVQRLLSVLRGLQNGEEG